MYHSSLELSTISFFDLIFIIFFFKFSDYFIFLYYFLDLFILISLLFNFYIDILTPSLNFSYFTCFNSLDYFFIFFVFDFLKFLVEFAPHNTQIIEYDSFFINLFVYFTQGLVFLSFIVFSIIVFVTFCPITVDALGRFFPFPFLRLLYSLSGAFFEYRVTFNFMLLFVFFFFWFFFLIFCPDSSLDVIDSVHLLLFYSFFFFILFFCFRYSTHFLSFLEVTLVNNLSVSFLLKQFVRDCSNLIALFLRFFLLIFRLNIYDSLDDFLDSYYIFLCDFDEDFLFNEVGFFLFSDFFFYCDNHEDSTFFNELEFFQIFPFFFLFFGKFVFFVFFLLEELFRLLLSIYIIYLILFEIHSTNVSYRE